MKGKTVWIIGDHLSDYVAAAIEELIGGCAVGKVVLIAKDKAGHKSVSDLLPKDLAKDALEVLIAGDGIEEAMDEALATWGRPTTVLSMPGESLPDSPIRKWQPAINP